MSEHHTKERRLTRRASLVQAGGLAAAALGAWKSGVLDDASDSATAATGPAAVAAGLVTCVLTPEQTEGPYYVEVDNIRRNITEGMAGVALTLRLAVVNASTCKPIRGAVVDIWHCDADGVYSGFESRSAPTQPGGGGPGGGSQEPSSATRYLRGHQRTDADGEATFLTIFPGWYRGRTPHIHLKVHVGGEVVHTGQVFFNERTTAAVYRQAPYSSHGQSDTSHSEDTIYAQAGRSRAVMRLRRRTRGRRGYRGTITLGVAT
jgi:protocatechuate 3,4-dioxygenase beta subunit